MALAGRVARPGYLLKLCAEAPAVRAALPAGCEVEATGHVMIAGSDWDPRPLAAGFRIEVQADGDARYVHILTRSGDLAASGHAAETVTALVFDRIHTAPDHRRRGLGRAVMAALLATRRSSAAGGVLVASDAGRALYETIRWRVISAYAAASVPAETGSCRA